MIAVGLVAHHLAAVCEEPEMFLRVTHPIAETDGFVIHICRDRNDISSVWPLLEKYCHGDRLGFATGDAIQLSGRARVDWDPERAARFDGAERTAHEEGCLRGCTSRVPGEIECDLGIMGASFTG